MDPAEQKQQFSIAYVHAVAAAAGFFTDRRGTDDDSVDLQIGGKGLKGIPSRPRVEVQLKCTSEEILRGEEVVYRIPAKNYHDLRVGEVILPRILVVVHVPRRAEDWLRHDEQEMAMRRCGYWRSLRGMEDVPNASRVTVRIPRSNRFDVAGLRAIMDRVTRRQPL